MQPRKHYTYHKLVPMRRYPGLGSGFSTSLSDFALVNSDPAAADEQSEENECPVTSEEEAERDAPSPGRLKSCQKLGVLLVVLGLVGVALRLATYPAASSPRLLAVLHVGPHKSGSTSLQSSSPSKIVTPARTFKETDSLTAKQTGGIYPAPSIQCCSTAASAGYSIHRSTAH